MVASVAALVASVVLVASADKTAMSDFVRILGIDPGLNHTGFGVIDVQGANVRFVTAGVIIVPKGELAERLHFIFTEVDKIAKETTPMFAACEKVFVNVNPHTTLLLGQARGAALTGLAFNQLSVHEFTPTEIKQAVVGTGRATKAQIQAMMSHMLGLPEKIQPDAADALACAMCAAQSFRMVDAMQVPKTTAGRARRRSSGSKIRSAWETHLGVNRQ